MMRRMMRIGLGAIAFRRGGLLLLGFAGPLAAGADVDAGVVRGVGGAARCG